MLDAFTEVVVFIDVVVEDFFVDGLLLCFVEVEAVSVLLEIFPEVCGTTPFAPLLTALILDEDGFPMGV